MKSNCFPSASFFCWSAMSPILKHTVHCFSIESVFRNPTIAWFPVPVMRLCYVWPHFWVKQWFLHISQQVSTKDFFLLHFFTVLIHSVTTAMTMMLAIGMAMVVSCFTMGVHSRTAVTRNLSPGMLCALGFGQNSCPVTMIIEWDTNRMINHKGSLSYPWSSPWSSSW